MPSSTGDHRCHRCRAVLRRANTSRLCDPCRRAYGPMDGSRRLPADFYRRPEVVAALTAFDFGWFFRAVRSELGLTQDEFGLLTGLAQSRVCKVESGNLRLRDVAVVARLASILDTPAQLLGFDARGGTTLESGPDDQVVDWLRRRDFTTTVTALVLGTGITELACDRLASLIPSVATELPHRIGAADVDHIEAATAAFRDWNHRWGNGLSLEAIVSQLRWVVAVGQRATISSTAVRARLLTATVDLAAVAAWGYFDVERHAEARRLWMVALSTSREVENPDLTRHILIQLAHQAIHMARPDEALQLLRLGYVITAGPDQHASERALSKIAAYEAWCYAAMGNARSCERALGRARDHFETAHDERPSRWLADFDHAELAGLSGHIYHVLAEVTPTAARQAEPLLLEAVNGRSPQFSLRKTLNTVSLAATHFQIGDDLENATAIADEALQNAASLSSPFALTRLDVLNKVTAPYAHRRAVAEFRERLQSVQSHAN